jgi:hypothetical protein
MKKLLFLLAVALGSVLAPGRATAEFLIALTATNQLISFDSATPGTQIGSPRSITGLQSGDTLVGIDLRPANGLLYGLATNGTTGRLYTINQATGVAALASTLSQLVSGQFFGIDFNPVVDRLRVVSDARQNLAVNVDTGATVVDGALAYAAGDPNAAATPLVSAAAYTNNFAGATSTTLFDLDASVNFLVTQRPPASGALQSVGLLSLATTLDASFDISGQTGVAYAVLDGFSLSTVNLSNGAVTFVGDINTPGFIIGLAAPVGAAVPVPGTAALAGTGFASLLAYGWRRRKQAGGA